MKPAAQMTTPELSAEWRARCAEWDCMMRRRDHDGHGGSPGEWLWERLGELEQELRRRAPAPFRGRR